MLENKVAIVTGSTKGIGYAIAAALAERGASVIVTSRQLSAAEEVANSLQSLTIKRTQRVLGYGFNLENTEDYSALVGQVIEHFGQIDCLVNNAISQNASAPLATLTDSQIMAAITTNIGNTLLLTRACYPFLKDSSGSVLNIGSVIINRHLQGLALYATIKGALEQLTKALAAEWSSQGIRVNAINPGFIKTAAFAEMGMPEELIDQNYEFYKSYCPVGHIGHPRDIGSLAAYLLSDDARFVSGATINVDGGYSVQGLPLFQGADNSTR